MFQLSVYLHCIEVFSMSLRCKQKRGTNIFILIVSQVAEAVEWEAEAVAEEEEVEEEWEVNISMSLLVFKCFGDLKI